MISAKELKAYRDAEVCHDGYEYMKGIGNIYRGSKFVLQVDS
jgi:hypothetical protein